MSHDPLDALLITPDEFDRMSHAAQVAHIDQTRATVRDLVPEAGALIDAGDTFVKALRGLHSVRPEIALDVVRSMAYTLDQYLAVEHGL